MPLGIFPMTSHSTDKSTPDRSSPVFFFNWSTTPRIGLFAFWYFLLTDSCYQNFFIIREFMRSERKRRLSEPNGLIDKLTITLSYQRILLEFVYSYLSGSTAIGAHVFYRWVYHPTSMLGPGIPNGTDNLHCASLTKHLCSTHTNENVEIWTPRHLAYIPNLSFKNWNMEMHKFMRHTLRAESIVGP